MRRFTPWRAISAAAPAALLVHVVVGNAFFHAVEVDTGVRHDLLEGRVAVRTQCHQLMHVAFEGPVIAVGQKLQAPAVLQPPLTQGELRPEQQRRFLAEHPFQRLPGGFAVGPGLAIAHRNLGGIGKAGFQRSTGLTVNHGNFMALLQQVPGGADADDAGAEYGNFHPRSVRESGQAEKRSYIICKIISPANNRNHA
jgi:hypothetical protein